MMADCSFERPAEGWGLPREVEEGQAHDGFNNLM